MVDQRLGNIFFKTQQYGMSQNFVGIVIWKSQFKTIYFQKFRRRNIFFCFPEENIRGTRFRLPQTRLNIFLNRARQNNPHPIPARL